MNLNSSVVDVSDTYYNLVRIFVEDLYLIGLAKILYQNPLRDLTTPAPSQKGLPDIFGIVCYFYGTLTALHLHLTSYFVISRLLLVINSLFVFYNYLYIVSPKVSSYLVWSHIITLYVLLATSYRLNSYHCFDVLLQFYENIAVMFNYVHYDTVCIVSLRYSPREN